MFGKDRLNFDVGRDLSAPDRSQRFVDRFQFINGRMVHAMTARLDFQGDLRKLLLILFGPLFRPCKHLSEMSIHANIDSTNGGDLH